MKKPLTQESLPEGPWKKPLAAVYGCATAARNHLFDVGLLRAKEVGLPVISVGNLTAGGSGKSPFAQFLAQELLLRNRRPVILTRGYGGSETGPCRVSKNDRVEDVGDEAVMHAQVLGDLVPVVVARRRVVGAEFIERVGLGDVVVLDDGFQHRWLKRNIDLLLVDTTDVSLSDIIFRESLLPEGTLRESAKSALSRVGAIVSVTRGRVPEERPEHFRDIPLFHFVLEPTSFVDIVSGERLPLASFGVIEAQALSAIAKPQPFFDMLDQLGVILQAKLEFPDHHLVTESDWNGLVDGIPTFVTAKDAVKVRRFVKRAGQVFALELGGRIVGRGEDFFGYVSGSLS